MGSAFFLPVLNLVTATDRFNWCVESEKKSKNEKVSKKESARKSYGLVQDL